MAKRESSVAPKERINVTFKPATGGAQEEIELPLKVMVLGDFKRRPDEIPLAERKSVSINKNNFADVMAKQNLSLTISVPNALQDDSENDLPVYLEIQSMRDFEPESIVRQIPEANQLMQIREALVSLKGPVGNIPAFRKSLEEIAQDPASRDAINKELEDAGIKLAIPKPAKGKKNAAELGKGQRK